MKKNVNRVSEKVNVKEIETKDFLEGILTILAGGESNDVK